MSNDESIWTYTASKLRRFFHFIKNSYALRHLEPEYKIVNVEKKNGDYLVSLQVTGSSIIATLKIDELKEDKKIMDLLIDADKDLVNSLVLQKLGIHYKIIKQTWDSKGNHSVLEIVHLNGIRSSIMKIPLNEVTENCNLSQFSSSDQKLIKALLE